MNSFNNLGKVLSNLKSVQLRSISVEGTTSINIGQTIEALAFFVAQAWQDTYANAHPHSVTDFNHCVACVTTEMAKAGAAVGGPTGLEILTGGGSKAAHIVCKRILSEPFEAGPKAKF